MGFIWWTVSIFALPSWDRSKLTVGHPTNGTCLLQNAHIFSPNRLWLQFNFGNPNGQRNPKRAANRSTPKCIVSASSFTFQPFLSLTQNGHFSHRHVIRQYLIQRARHFSVFTFSFHMLIPCYWIRHQFYAVGFLFMARPAESTTCLNNAKWAIANSIEIRCKFRGTCSRHKQ